jgi:hypothetical protein
LAVRVLMGKYGGKKPEVMKRSDTTKAQMKVSYGKKSSVAKKGG